MKVPTPQLLRALRSSLSQSKRPCAQSLQFLRSSIPSRCSRPFTAIGTQHNASAPPATRSRGPKSSEETQTDFPTMDVLGNMAPPSTAIDACVPDGFHLNSGVKITDHAGVILVSGEAFAWRPWAKAGGGARSTMINNKGQWEVGDDVWGVLDLMWPKPDLLILGLGATIHPLSPRTRRQINEMGIRIDVQDTRNAAAQFNLLATERGASTIAAALIPIGWKGKE